MTKKHHMRLSRREFVGSAVASAGGLCFFEASGWNAAGRGDERGLKQASGAILELGSECVLRESMLGYQTTLGGLPVCAAKEVNLLTRSSMVIVPGAGALSSPSVLLLLHLLDAGARLLLECGAGFSDAAELAAQRETLQRFFGITVQAPVDLWSRGEPVPYVNYEWPRRVMVRDFSRAVPVSGRSGEVIARIGAIPVGLKKRAGNGTLVFLGSPLGPSLRAGDLDAHLWLLSFATIA